MIKTVVLICLLILIVTELGVALECYVCDNQEDNNGKCITTIKTCNYGEDECLTEISWGSTPYWQQGALKQYYISKRCSTKKDCADYRASNMDTCTHIWYQDWRCSECCKGDRCNYYVISGAIRISTVTPALILVSILALPVFTRMFSLSVTTL